ncbi:3-aminobutyryl-CoA ammonia lyase [Acidaminobacter sp. JC074]|uniref:3-aminobutyryl-CoA ammonia lyase n=1 Tax=Acidaminobacter sp. JC074 TaxID=2530199 RepID=UPI001F0E1992|nr:hotdog fold thioesterase [Acidaminobacter sp. JC074]MCH4888500.1 3-aminobutyryl-CoA ammonia lyase [Acidaminobacter sp. JC074]
MVGEKVIIKVRLSMEDAHYAGELVNGSKMLDFFGDVATELLIRLDGDEGLFRTYNQVDFLAPTYAGDFMEYHGWIEKVGNTSRVMKFEAYKIIELARDKDLAASAANVLNPPILVGTAEGVCITPKECQRESVLEETLIRTV